MDRIPRSRFGLVGTLLQLGGLMRWEAAMHLGDPREMRRYMTLSQVGLEMVAPIGLGLALDFYLGWLPWATVVGAAVGFAVGVVHLTWVVNKDEGDSSPPPGSKRESR